MRAALALRRSRTSSPSDREHVERDERRQACPSPASRRAKRRDAAAAAERRNRARAASRSRSRRRPRSRAAGCEQRVVQLREIAIERLAGRGSGCRRRTPSRKTIARNPSHFGSYRNRLASGSASASFASIGSTGGAIANVAGDFGCPMETVVSKTPMALSQFLHREVLTSTRVSRKTNYETSRCHSPSPSRRDLASGPGAISFIGKRHSTRWRAEPDVVARGARPRGTTGTDRRG